MYPDTTKVMTSDLQYPFQVTSTAQLHDNINLRIILIHPMKTNNIATVLYAAHQFDFFPNLLHCLFLRMH